MIQAASPRRTELFCCTAICLAQASPILFRSPRSTHEHLLGIDITRTALKKTDRHRAITTFEGFSQKVASDTRVVAMHDRMLRMITGDRMGGELGEKRYRMAIAVLQTDDGGFGVNITAEITSVEQAVFLAHEESTAICTPTFPIITDPVFMPQSPPNRDRLETTGQRFRRAASQMQKLASKREELQFRYLPGGSHDPRGSQIHGMIVIQQGHAMVVRGKIEHS